MIDPLASHTSAAPRRGVSPSVAFTVVALAAFVALGVAFARRDTLFEASAVVEVATDNPLATTNVTTREAGDAIAKHFQHTETRSVGSESCQIEKDATWILGPSRKEKFCVVVARSPDAHRLAERLNDAVGRFVDQRNASAIRRAEQQHAALRKTTLERRKAAAAAEQRLWQLEMPAIRAAAAAAAENAEASSASDSPPRAAQTEPAAAPSRQPPPTLNPQWVLLRDEVSLLEGELAALRGRFTEQHPEVQHAIAVLAERQSQFASTPRHVDGQSDTVTSPPAPAAPPLVAPQSENFVETPSPPRPEELEAARSALAEANARLDDAQAAENLAARRQQELAANPPWRYEAADAVRPLAGDSASAPWLAILVGSVVAGLAAALLARGLRRIIDSPADAVAALGVNVIGLVRTEAPLPPRPADPGVVSARWLVRGGVTLLAAFAVVAYLAATASRLDLAAVSRDPASLFGLSRDWLAQRIG